MRILFLANQLEMGGIETNIVRLCRSLVSRGHEVTVGTRGGELVGEVEAAGGRHRVTDLFSRLGSVRSFRSLIAEERPDVIHSFSASASIRCAAARLTLPPSKRPPVVASIMGLKNSPQEREALTLLRVYLTTVGAGRVIVIAPAIGHALSKLPVSGKRLIEMPVVGIDDFPSVEGVRLDRSEVREELGLRPDVPVVMTVGNLEPRKSHELFIRAAALASEKFPDAHFFVIGGGQTRAQLEREVAATGKGTRIHLLGNRPDASRVIRAADVYVRPGVVEGFVGITVLEAQAAAVPVVSFETEDVKLAIEHERTGWLVRNGDVEQMSEAIRMLLKDEVKAAAIGRAGLEAVRDSFSMDAVTTSLERLYAQMVGRG